MNDSPYLKSSRLRDVITALQFLGKYRKYRLYFHDSQSGDKDKTPSWDQKIAISPISSNSWREIFEEHPEFFRKDQDPKDLFVSLVWRRATEDEAPLEADAVCKLIDIAISLHASALSNKSMMTNRKIEQRRWIGDQILKCLTALLAALAAVFSAWLTFAK